MKWTKSHRDGQRCLKGEEEETTKKGKNYGEIVRKMQEALKGRRTGESLFARSRGMRGGESSP